MTLQGRIKELSRQYGINSMQYAKMAASRHDPTLLDTSLIWRQVAKTLDQVVNEYEEANGGRDE